MLYQILIILAMLAGIVLLAVLVAPSATLLAANCLEWLVSVLRAHAYAWGGCWRKYLLDYRAARFGAPSGGEA